MDESFQQTLRCAQAGHRRAVSALYRDHNAVLVQFFRPQAPDLAEDLAHETWIAAGEILPQFRGNERAFRVWLLSMARRQLAIHRQTSGPDRPSPVAPDRLTGLAGSRDNTDPAADAALAQLLTGLPQVHVEVLLLRVVAGLSAEEAAAVIGKSAGAVRVIQHRALRRLAQRLTTEGVRQ